MAIAAALDLPSIGLGRLPKAATGIRGLDEVTGGGLPRGRSTLVCGPAGLIDIWLLVTTHEEHGERIRSLSVLKARGMAHSNKIREFLLTEHGIELVDAHGPGEAL